jgi:hypothetical protein
MNNIDLLLFLLPPLSFTAFVILPAICGLFFQPYRGENAHSFDPEKSGMKSGSKVFDSTDCNFPWLPGLLSEGGAPSNDIGGDTVSRANRPFIDSGERVQSLLFNFRQL